MTSQGRTRVMLVDDHAIMRDGLQEVLEGTGEFEVVAQASDGVEAVRIAQSIAPEVIIMDVIMPVKDGIEACQEIMAILPDTKVLMLSASSEEDAIVMSVAAGAAGYLAKYSGKEKLLQTVRSVAEGEFRIPGEAARRMSTKIRAVSGVIKGWQPDILAASDREMLRMFVDGLSYAAIAECRNVSPLDARNAIHDIQEKLGIGTRQHLVVWAVRSGLLEE